MQHGLLETVAPLVAVSVAVLIYLIQAGGARLVERSTTTEPVPAELRERWTGLEEELDLRASVRYRVRKDIAEPAAMSGGAAPFRRTVFVSPTFLTEVSTEKQDAVIAHELGHVRSRHILRRALLTAVAVGGLAYVLLGAGFVPMGLMLLSYVAISAELIRQEYEADKLAAGATRPVDVATGIWTLAKAQQTVADYGRTVSIISMRPSIPERIRRIREQASDSAES